MQQNHLIFRENGMSLTPKVSYWVVCLPKSLRFCAANTNPATFRTLTAATINAEKVKLTGRKLTQNKYFKHTGGIGGIKETTPAKILAGRFPERVIEKAVERMISRNPLGRQQMTKLKVYAGSEHPHTAQNPEVLDIATKNPKNKRSAL